MATKSSQPQRRVRFDDLPTIKGIFCHTDGAEAFAPMNGELWPVLSNDATGHVIVIARDGTLYRA
jgi:hypothetical protein